MRPELFSVFALVMLSATPVFGQHVPQTLPQIEKLQQPKTTAAEAETAQLPGSPSIAPTTGAEYFLSTAVLIFGVIIVGMAFAVIILRKLVWDDASLLAVTLPVVVFSGLFLITAGYSEYQVAPMFGLLGTIVGYILGSRKAPAA